MHKCMFGAIAAAAIAFAPIAALADSGPAGTYAVRGTNPNGSPYKGTVTVVQTGETYQVEWTVGGSVSRGTGIFQSDVLSVAGSLGQDQFVFVMLPDGKGLNGTWAIVGSRQIGTETWGPE